MTFWSAWRRRVVARRRVHHERVVALTTAEEESASVRARADRVGDLLERRLRRNHWSETVAAIARKEL